MSSYYIVLYLLLQVYYVLEYCTRATILEYFVEREIQCSTSQTDQKKAATDVYPVLSWDVLISHRY
jgi:hypothetical protein